MNKTKRTFSLIAIIIMVSFQTVYGQKIEITGQILNDITG
ncbi:MAG: hypothetical protein ACI9L9_002691, partial [Marivirga sp.]